MNVSTLIVLLLIAALAVSALRYTFKHGGCSSCKGAGGCSGCANAGHCSNVQKKCSHKENGSGSRSGEDPIEKS